MSPIHATAAVIAAVIASMITMAIFTPYLIGIWRGSLRPHVISWVIWGLTTVMVAGGQWLAGAQLGAVPILLSGILSSAVAILAWLRSRDADIDLGITRFDRWCLGIALACIPLWLATNEALWSMLILTAIDLIGFAPTLRTIWRHPHRESALLFLAFAARNAIAILAVHDLNLTTVVFPASIGLACMAVTALILIRRQMQPG